MRYFSLFSGIGGFELGIKQAYEQIFNEVELGRCGQKKSELETSLPDIISESNERQRPDCVGFSEIDKYAVQIYQKHFPNHKNYGDIKKIDPTTIPDFELLVGGFPCQAFSIAGKRKGFEDTRGTLFFDIARILQVKKPRLFLLENVKGLLSHDNGKTFSTIIATLDALGYDLQWQVLNSKNFGVPQNRERIFIIGNLRGTSRPQVFPFTEQSNENTTIGKSTKTTIARTLTGGGHTGGNHSGMTILQLNNPTHSNNRIYSEKGISPTLNTAQGGNRQPKILQRARGNNKGGEKKISPTITKNSFENNNHLVKDLRIRRLTPMECERLQGFPDGWTAEGGALQAERTTISDAQRYKTIGNAVTVNVIRAIAERLLYN